MATVMLFLCTYHILENIHEVEILQYIKWKEHNTEWNTLLLLFYTKQKKCKEDIKYY
jgi:hypothetical protein